MKKRLGVQDEEEDEVKVVSNDCQSGANVDAGVTTKWIVLVEEAMKVVQLSSQGEGPSTSHLPL